MGGHQLRPIRQPCIRLPPRQSRPGAARPGGLGALSGSDGALNADAPAIFLYAPANIAVAAERIENVTIDPYSWASGLRDWRATAP
jgi:hypothetical protein